MPQEPLEIHRPQRRHAVPGIVVGIIEALLCILSAADWASLGVRINAIAPGNVETAMTAKLTPQERVAVLALPIPTLYGEDKLMDPADIASSIVFLVSQQAHGINGIILFCDGGTDALLNTEKVY